MPEPIPSVLQEVFRDLRIRQSRYLHSTLVSPWGLRIPNTHPAVLHVVVNGSCILDAGEDRATLNRGDVVLLPHGDEHELISEPGGRVHVLPSLSREAISHLGCSLSHGEEEAPWCSVVSGSLAFEPHPLLTSLPVMLTMAQDETGPARHTASIVTSLMDEVAVPGSGSETVVNRLADVLVIRAIRHWLETTDHDQGWLAALQHPGLGRALALMHNEAAKPWSLVELAQAAGMSRAGFAKTFGEVVGSSPIQFLSERRMELAARWLRDDGVSVAEVSHRLGYASPAAFSRAFKRITGDTPGAVARTSA